MSLNTVPTNYHEYEYSKFSVFKLKFMTTGRIHASRWVERWTSHATTQLIEQDLDTSQLHAVSDRRKGAVYRPGTVYDFKPRNDDFRRGFMG